MADGTATLGADAGAKTDWISRVLGIDVTQSRPGPSAAPSGRASEPAGLAAWGQARAAAIASLNALADAVTTLDIPEARAATILLRAVRANLTEAPTTPQQVAELRRYLQTDDVIEEAEHPNGFGITVALRVPLLAALDALALPNPNTGVAA
jgi:alkylhydroperoxidase family enzyme